MLVITTWNENGRARGDSLGRGGECKRGSRLRDDETIIHEVVVKCTPGRVSPSLSLSRDGAFVGRWIRGSPCHPLHSGFADARRGRRPRLEARAA